MTVSPEPCEPIKPPDGVQLLSRKALGAGAWVPQETWDRLLSGQLPPTAKDVAFQMPAKGIWMTEDDYKVIINHVADWRAYRRRVEACFAVTWPNQEGPGSPP